MRETQAGLEFDEIDSTVRSHEYKDGSVDGELSVIIGRGMDATSVARSLESAFGTENMRGIWFSIGTRFSVARNDFDQAETRYDRHRGMYQASMYWRKLYRNDKRQRTSQIIDPFGQFQKRVIPGIEKEYGRKVQQVILRLHWSPGGKKPDRD